MFTPLFDFLVTVFWAYGLWAFFAIIPLYFVGMILIEEKKIVIPQKYSAAAAALFLGLPFVIFLFLCVLNPYFLGYGYATDNFEVAARNDNALWGVNYWILPGGEGTGSSISYRIQGLELDGGKIYFRRIMPDFFEVLGQKDGTVWVSDGNDVLGMDIKTGMTKVTVNEKNLAQQFPELSGGVHEYKLNPQTLLFDVTSKLGAKISVDPLTGTKAEPVPQPEDKERYEMLDTVITENYQTHIALKGDVVEKLVDGTGKIINDDVTFLEGKFILHDRASGRVVILSYATLDKNEFIVRSFTANGKLLWEARQGQLGVGDIFIPAPPFETAFYYKDSVIIAFDGFVMSLDKSTGKPNWVSRM
jgi:outer membrane protein assembly factor BamB